MESKDATRWELIDLDILQRPADGWIGVQGRGCVAYLLNIAATDPAYRGDAIADVHDLPEARGDLRGLLTDFEAITYQPSDQHRPYRVH